MIFVWSLVFIISFLILLKGADWLLDSAEKIGLVVGLSPFVVGVVIVGMGTSLPELFSSLMAVWQGVPEIVVANAVGSNIANILLIVGIAAILASQLKVTKNLINLDLPLLALTTALFLMVAWDQQINIYETVLLLASYAIYIAYIAIHQDEIETKELKKKAKSKLKLVDFVWLVLGILGLALGSKFLIDSVIALSDILQIGAGVIAITAVALGTSLPELFVSVKAALNKKPEVAIGNIFGSNVFNLTIVIGLPGLFGTLPLDDQTFTLGLITMTLATVLFIFSGISQKIHIWEGAMFLLLYILFIAKLFAWF